MKYDHQIVNKRNHILYKKFINPYRKKKAIWKYLYHDIYADIDYAFYPLHTEPELTINVYAKEFLNQIEVIRLIANSLPISMRLLIKEHPATLGRRSMSFYKKLAEIPNVVLLKYDKAVFEVIQKSAIIFVITGTTALEAIYLKKPVIFFGKVPYEFLPAHIVQKARIYEFSEQIRDFLQSYTWDEQSVLNFISAILSGSSQINLITEVLQKKGRLNLTRDTNSYNDNISLIADHLYERMKQENLF